jgi:uncharacterized protein (DUF952 family)
VTDPTILHITTAAGWDAAQAAGELRAPSLAQEGFIHCSTDRRRRGVPAHLRAAQRRCRFVSRVLAKGPDGYRALDR